MTELWYIPFTWQAFLSLGWDRIGDAETSLGRSLICSRGDKGNFWRNLALLSKNFSRLRGTGQGYRVGGLFDAATGTTEALVRAG